MIISLEISHYPLKNEFLEQISQFIKSLKDNQKVEVITKGLSTQIFGEYDDVMSLLTNKVKDIFEKNENSVFVLKIVNADARKYM